MKQTYLAHSKRHFYQRPREKQAPRFGRTSFLGDPRDSSERKARQGRIELPDDVAAETGKSLTLEVRRKIMGENAARLYDIDIAERRKKLGLSLPAKAEAAAAMV